MHGIVRHEKERKSLEEQSKCVAPLDVAALAAEAETERGRADLMQAFPEGVGNSIQLSPDMAATPLFVSVRPRLQPVIPVFIQVSPEQVLTGVDARSKD